MSNSDLIKALESFKSNTYTVEELITFIKGNPVLKDFYYSSASRFLGYLKTNHALMKRFVEDLHISNEQYDKEEIAIIDDILKKRLHFFYVLHCLDKGEDIVNTKDDIFRELAVYFLLEENGKNELIDYIILFGVMSNNNIAQPIINNTELTEEEIEILRLRKNLTDNSFAEIGKHCRIIASDNSIKQKSYILRSKLGASNIDEAIRIFEEKYYKL